MAEAFLKIVLENLSSLIKDEIGFIMGVDLEMKKLLSTFTTIQAVLEDAEIKKLKDKAIQNWLGKLKDLAYEIDDILDECATHVSKLKLKNSKLSRYSLKKVVFQHKIGRRMKHVSEKLDAVAAEREKFHLREMATVERFDGTRETGSILNESDQVYGRDEDKKMIVDMLVNDVKENEQISVLPILGVGGLGKTTLAQLVYNDQRVVDHFEMKLWVCVSDDFDIKTLVRAMIESATGSGSASDLKQLDTLERRLWELLNQKRYLLVLDDVWNENQEKWSLLKNILACGSNGTSIIVTTRLKMVVDIMGTVEAHSLKGLSEEHCWMLMRDRAFGEKEKEKYPNLEAIGKQIVKKCAGVPMAAKALGGLLRFKRTDKEWVYVKESELWNLPQDQTLILPALRLSYHHLPLELRQCFAYFAVFPKDFRIKRKKLIFLWMGHGYISSRGALEVEDVGNDICNELVLRSLFQCYPFETDYVMMHDLVHDLAQSIMENKVPGVQVERQVASTSNSKIREVNLGKKYARFPVSIQHDMELSSVLTKLSHLRVLNAKHTTIKELPSTLGNLKHLRFLNLSSTKIRTLPNSLCSLWNLQILNLDECWKLVVLPKNMRYLKNLRHLCLEYCPSLEEMPSRIGELTCLKTLSQFIVGHDRGNQLEELQCLNLVGKLKITHLERVGSHMDAKKANLGEKKELRHLSLEWERYWESESRPDTDEKVMEALQPHPNLETLRIWGFNGRCFPIWMTDSTLEKIVHIEIRCCKNILSLPQLGQLPLLKFLSLDDLEVEYMVEGEVDGGNILFPSLEKLQLNSLPRLKGVSREQAMIQVFPNLEKLRIHSCSSLILPQLSSLQELEVHNCSSLLLASLTNLNALTSLDVEFGENMKCIPIETLEKLTNLESLTIYQPQEESLPEEGLQALESLTKFNILCSETLTCLPVGWLRHLTALKLLGIYGCQEFVELPEEIKELEYIETINLVDVAKMVGVPKALRHLSSLQSLSIQSIPQLDSLPDWLEDLTSLRHLYIRKCPTLVSLPDCIRGIPNLQTLSINKCPELERRCERGTGEDWKHEKCSNKRIFLEAGILLMLLQLK